MLNLVKKVVLNKYNIKNLKKIKPIIRFQLIKGYKVKILNINQLAFKYNFIKNKNIINYNIIIILMNVNFYINLQKTNNYKKAIFRYINNSLKS